MTTETKVGAGIVRTIAVLTSVPISTAVLLSLLVGQAVPVQGWIGLGVSLTISWLLVRGSWWARGWIITGLILGGLAAAAQVILNYRGLGIGGTIVVVLVGAAYLLGAGLLGWSRAVEAYFEQENRVAALHLS